MLTADLLKTYLDYNPETGVFTWIAHRYNTCLNGTVAGSHARGRNIICIGIPYRANRLAWLYMTGKWPVGVVDHVDRNPMNDVWTNLRDVSQQINTQNASIRKSDSGHKGISKSRNGRMWRVSIVSKQQFIHIGMYDTIETAIEARVQAEKKYFPEIPISNNL